MMTRGFLSRAMRHLSPPWVPEPGGQSVREGDPLFEIRSQAILDRSSELRIVQEDLAGLERQQFSLLLENAARVRADNLELERLGHRERQLQVEVQEARALQELSRRW